MTTKSNKDWLKEPFDPTSVCHGYGVKKAKKKPVKGCGEVDNAIKFLTNRETYVRNYLANKYIYTNSNKKSTSFREKDFLFKTQKNSENLLLPSPSPEKEKDFRDLMFLHDVLIFRELIGNKPAYT